jgi:hypothetical protein
MSLKSVSGFTVYCNGQLISAKSWKQEILAESTCEAELIAANTGAHDAVWLEQLIDELKLARTSTSLHCDSSSARELMQHAGKHRRTKQLRIPQDPRVRGRERHGREAGGIEGECRGLADEAVACGGV